MKDDLRKRFLTKTEDSGRFIVKSARTGKTYAVEPIGMLKTNWGSIDQASGKLVNKKGHDKYRGAIDEKESLITEANGFINIRLLEPGDSPLAQIDMLDAKYPDKIDV